MSENTHANHSFFDCLKRAKEEFQSLTETHPELAALSARELEVFYHLLSDKTLSMIAEELVISYSSVHFHCKNIYRKLGMDLTCEPIYESKKLYHK